MAVTLQLHSSLPQQPSMVMHNTMAGFTVRMASTTSVAACEMQDTTSHQHQPNSWSHHPNAMDQSSSYLQTVYSAPHAQPACTLQQQQALSATHWCTAPGRKRPADACLLTTLAHKQIRTLTNYNDRSQTVTVTYCSTEAPAPPPASSNPPASVTPQSWSLISPELPPAYQPSDCWSASSTSSTCLSVPQQAPTSHPPQPTYPTLNHPCCHQTICSLPSLPTQATYSSHPQLPVIPSWPAAGPLPQCPPHPICHLVSHQQLLHPQLPHPIQCASFWHPSPPTSATSTATPLPWPVPTDNTPESYLVPNLHCHAPVPHNTAPHQHAYHPSNLHHTYPLPASGPAIRVPAIPPPLPTWYTDINSPAALSEGNHFMLSIQLPGNVEFHPVVPGSLLHRLGALCEVSAASICLAQSYYLRLVVAMPGLQRALHILSQQPKAVTPQDMRALQVSVTGAPAAPLSRQQAEAIATSVKFTCIALAAKMLEARSGQQKQLQALLSRVTASASGPSTAFALEMKVLHHLEWRLGPYFDLEEAAW